MKVTIKLFASCREVVGERTLVRDIAQDSTVDQLFVQLKRAFPRLAGMQQNLRVAVNGEFCAWNTSLKEGDEVALIPPVSGG